jgi:hypothetical protein
MMPPSKARLHILLLLEAFDSLENLTWFLPLIGSCICVRDANINYTVRSSFPESSHEDISTIFVLGDGYVGLSCLGVATCMIFWFSPTTEDWKAVDAM